MNPLAAVRPRRSALYAPGANPRALEKTRETDADVFILDLEDAVAPEAKAEARSHVARHLAARAPDGRELIVRVNGLDSPWCRDDLAAVLPFAPEGILFPKIDSAADAAHAATLLEGAASRLWCMIETPLAILNLQAIGAQARGARLAGWVMGSNDLAKALGAAHTPDRAPLLYALGAAVMAARAYGLAILDGVHNDIADLAGLRRECEQARAMGFDGKTLIHPSQVAGCNEAFSPDPETVAQARRIIAAFECPENAGKGVLRLDGKMVELLHAEMARTTVAVADAIAARNAARGQSP